MGKSLIAVFYLSTQLKASNSLRKCVASLRVGNSILLFDIFCWRLSDFVRENLLIKSPETDEILSRSIQKTKIRFLVFVQVDSCHSLSRKESKKKLGKNRYASSIHLRYFYLYWVTLMAKNASLLAFFRNLRWDHSVASIHPTNLLPSRRMRSIHSTMRG